MMSFKIPPTVKNIVQKLKESGFEAYIVGGCVRDIILGRDTNDWDFTTNAIPSEIMTVFPDGFYDNKFGTVGVPVMFSSIASQKPQVVYEITTFRSESDYTDHRHPDKVVWGKTLEDDLLRRDFTINAMALDGNKLIDLYDGQSDLENKIIRAVRDPNERFNEDALRMIRAVRIATELQFLIENNTFEAIVKNSKLLANVSGERIRDELTKIMSSSYPSDGIKLLRNSSLLSVILPDLDKCFGVQQKSPKRHHMYDVGTHLLLSLKNCPSKDPIVRLATLLHDIGKPVTAGRTAGGIITFYNHEIIGASIVRSIAQKLHMSKKDRERLIRLVRYHQFTLDEKQTDSAHRRFIRNIGKENLDDMLALRTGDRLGGGARETSWRLELFKKRLEDVQKQPFTVSDLKVDGYDVMKIYSIGPGRQVGIVLSILFNEVVEGKLKNEKAILLNRIEQLKKESHLK